MKKLKIILVGCMLMFSANVFADKLGDAKSQGLVGEKTDGYLGVVVDSPATKALVNEINTKRKTKYLQLAKKNNITLQQVQSLASKKTYSKTLSGHYIWKSGKWVKK